MSTTVLQAFAFTILTGLDPIQYTDYVGAVLVLDGEQLKERTFAVGGHGGEHNKHGTIIQRRQDGGQHGGSKKKPFVAHDDHRIFARTSRNVPMTEWFVATCRTSGSLC